MRDPQTFTVDDPRFSTGQVVGPSMLTRDGEEHRRHRAPFAPPFRHGAVHARFAQLVSEETERLIEGMRPAGHAELRRELAGPLAAAVVTRALGIQDADAGAVLGWYEQIVAAVTDITAGLSPSAAGSRAYAALSAAIAPALDRQPDASLLAAAAHEAGGLERERVISNAAVLLFGGIETTEGMIANAVWHLLSHPGQLALAAASPEAMANAIEESLRLEPAAAIVDRYATGDVEIAEAQIARGELVRVSIAGANRDPEVFARPDRFDVRRANARRHLAFAHGPARVHRDAPGAPGDEHRRRAPAGPPARSAPGPRPSDGAARARVPQAARAARALGLLMRRVGGAGAVGDRRQRVHAGIGDAAAHLAVDAELLQARDLALALDPRRMIGRQAADELGDPVAQLQREVGRRGAHELAHVGERDLVVRALAVGVLGLAHQRGATSSRLPGSCSCTISSRASMRACAVTEIESVLPMIQPWL